MTPRQAKAYLDLRGFGITPGLQRIEALMDLLDHPELTYPTIHLAGTNGKTSTARMITAILAAHGLVAGLYTSPHLIEVTERFGLAGWSEGGFEEEEMSDQDLAATLGYLAPFVELVENDLRDTLTYFELTTAIAFEWMSERSVGVGVVETGMGGRWDATNLIGSSVAVLTQVDVDHAEFLGRTARDNAEEKVGIIKPGSTVVSADQRPEVADLIESTARRQGARVLLEGREFAITANDTAVGGRRVGVRTGRADYPDLFLPLHGAHQAFNLAQAVTASEVFLDRPLESEPLAAGLAHIRSPGRLEVVGRQPLVVIDGAHNPHAARALAATLSDDFLFRRLVIVLSIFRDKDVAGILELLLPLAHTVIFTRSTSPRSSAPEELEELARGLGAAAELRVGPTIPEALSLAEAAAEAEDMVLITGSIQGAGEARKLILDRRSRIF